MNNGEKIRSIINFELPRWDQLPNFDIYNDQLVAIVEEVTKPLFKEGEKIITPSMVNNYVKWGIIKKPIKKKYNRLHIASCIAITCLKSVFSIKEIGKGIELQLKLMEMKDAYNLLCDILEKSINYEFNKLYSFFGVKFEEFILFEFIDDDYVTLEKFKEDVYIEMNRDNLALVLASRSLCNKIFTEIILDNQGLVSEFCDENS